MNSKIKQPTFKKLILDELKTLNETSIISKIKSITYDPYTMGDAVRVKAVNLGRGERERLETLLDSYQYGHFDGMQDMYIASNIDKNKRQAKYVTLTNEFCDSVKEIIRNNLARQGVSNDDEARAKCNCWLDQVIWRKLNDLTDDDLRGL